MHIPDEQNRLSSPAHFYIFTTFLSILCLVAVSYLWPHPEILSICLIANAGLIIYLGRARRDTLLFILSALWGAIAEMVAIAFGAWSYTIPFTFGIPYWLPLVWGTAGVFLVRLYDALGFYLVEKGNDD